MRCDDTQPEKIVERLTRRDRDTDADKVTIDISSKNDHLTAYHFDINVSGVLLDGVRFNDTDYDGNWDGIWMAATARDARGWSAEVEIPLSTLRYDGRATSFGFQVRRLIPRRQEVDEWAYIPRTASGEVSDYGTLVGLTGLATQRLLQALPYVVVKGVQLSNQAPLDGFTPTLSAGGDFKLGITPALTLDATVNPDFGDVEADQVVLNLTTFETFFPEKRPFFLEGADLWALPIQQYYSRRIGRAPPAPSLVDSELVAEPLPAGTIWGAAKLTGLIAPRLTVGALDALTASADAIVENRSGAPKTTRLADPLANFGVLRLKREFGAASYFGATATAVTRDEPAGLMAPAASDECPDGERPSPAGRCTHDAYTGGADLSLRTANGDYGAVAQLVGSVVEHGPQRTLYDGTVIGSGDTGLGIYARAGKYGGEHWLANVAYQGFTPRLELNDAGYLGEANLQRVHPVLGWRDERPLGPFLETTVQAEYWYTRSWDGVTLGRSAELDAFVRWRNFWMTWVEFSYDLDHEDNRETRDGALTERVGGPYFEIWTKTDPRKRLVLQLSGSLDRRVYAGLSSQSSLTLSLHPIPEVELDVIPHGIWTYGDPRWFDTRDNADGSRTYYFGELDSRSFDVTVRGTYTFTPTLTLQLYAQLFLASGHYGPILASTASGTAPLLRLSSFHGALMPSDDAPDFRDGTLNLNLILRWEFKPGSTITAVYSRAQEQLPYDPSEGQGRLRLSPFQSGPATDVLLVKLGYLFG